MALFFHHLGQRLVGSAIHRVHSVIHREYIPRNIRIRFNKRLQALAHHLRRERGHPRNIHGQIGYCHLLHVAHTIADALGRIAHAFQIGVNLNHAQNESQVDGHRLLHGKQIERRLIDVPLQPIDRILAAADQIADRQVADTIRLNSPLDGLFCKACHHQQVLFQFVEASLKPNARHPNLPVM